MKITQKNIVFSQRVLLIKMFWGFVFVYIFLGTGSDVLLKFQCHLIKTTNMTSYCILTLQLMQIHYFMWFELFEKFEHPDDAIALNKWNIWHWKFDNGFVSIDIPMYAYHRCQHQVLSNQIEQHAYRVFDTKYYDFWLMPGNRTIESEIRCKLFSVVQHILADMSKIYYERSLLGIVLPCLA